MIRYHFDLYPRDDPKDGTRLVRFTKLQSAEYRGEANGTGAGRFSLRADSTDAGFIDPLGLQYVRVVREDTEAATESVVGGFWLENGDFTALDEQGTRVLSFGGAGTLAYLQRAIMWSHVYFFGGQDPREGVYYTDDGVPQTVGYVLWRWVYQATLYRSAAYYHVHADGTIATDTHDDDRLENPLPALTWDFNGNVDSDGNAWTLPFGEEKAQVGDSLLQSVKRLMESGIYVSIDPDTFELHAWEAATHRRDRSGAAWGASVIRFQAPTGGDIATGNIKSDAKRAIAAFIRRSTILAGSQNTYGTAVGVSDIPWEGYQPSDAEDTNALVNLAEVQIGAREDAADTLRLRIRLGTDTSNGYYRPFEDILLDDIVTVHTGTGQWDLNEDTFPVAALTVVLRQGGDWDAFVDLGSTYTSMVERAFQSMPVKHHSHPPNPKPCVADVIVPAAVADSSADGGEADLAISHTIGSGGNMGLAVFIEYGGGDTPVVVWRPVVGNPATDETLTHRGTFTQNTGNLLVFTLDEPTAGTGQVRVDHSANASAVAVTIEDTDGYRGIVGTDVDTSSSTTTLQPVTVAGDRIVTGLTSPSASDATLATGTDLASFLSTGADPQGLEVGHQAAGSTSPTDVTWNYNSGTNWRGIAAVVWKGKRVLQAGRVELVGTSSSVKRCDDTEHYHTNADPTVNDDETEGFRLNTLWINDSTGAIFLATDLTAGAAVWLSVGGPTDHGALDGLADDDHPQYQKESEKGQANGYASLDASTLVPFAQLPTGTGGSQVAVGNHSHAAGGDGTFQMLLVQDGVSPLEAVTYDQGGTNWLYSDQTFGGGGAHTHDHGDLTGLADDDHSAYSDTTHTHPAYLSGESGKTYRVVAGVLQPTGAGSWELVPSNHDDINVSSITVDSTNDYILVNFASAATAVVVTLAEADNTLVDNGYTVGAASSLTALQLEIYSAGVKQDPASVQVANSNIWFYSIQRTA